MFEQLLGNENIKDQLRKMVQNNAVCPSLLFAGPEGVGKSLFALELANQLLESNGKRRHPDLHIYKPEGKIGMHSIESMRTFIGEVYLAPLEAKWKIFIIEDADRMLPYSANALLKTFEEPSADSIIILLSNSPDKLLTTIRSRCRIIRFAPIPENQISAYLLQQGLSAEEAALRARLSRGSLADAMRECDPLRDQILHILAEPKWRTWNELSSAVSTLTCGIEEEQKIVKEELTPKDPEMTAVQRQLFEKDVDGTLAMLLIKRANTIFTAILEWFRDLELLHIQGSKEHLANLDKEESLVACYQRGERLPLENVEKYIREAKVALDRSTPIAHALENLFLKLERI